MAGRDYDVEFIDSTFSLADLSTATASLANQLHSHSAKRPKKSAEYVGRAISSMDWVHHYPFPEFRPEQNSKVGSKRATRSDDGTEVAADDDDDETGEAPEKEGQREADDDILSGSFAIGPSHMDSDSDSCGSETPPVVKVHPLSSDWNQTHAPLSSAECFSMSMSGSRPGSAFSCSAVSFSDRQAPYREVIHDLSTQDESKHIYSTSEGGRRHLSTHSRSQSTGQSISREELMSLLTMINPHYRRSGALENVYLSWLWTGKKKKVVPPSSLLNLHTFDQDTLLKTSLSNNQGVINSPRSAIVMMRHGVRVRDILRRPRDGRHIRQLGPLQQKKVAREEYQMRRKTEKLREEYDFVCSRIHLDDVIRFAVEYDPKNPHLASYIPLHPHDYSAQRRTPQQLSNDKLHEMVSKTQERDTRVVKAQKCLAAAEKERREEGIASMLKTKRKIEGAIHLRDVTRQQHMENIRTKSESWRGSRVVHERVQEFQRMVRAENINKRVDEAVAKQQGLSNCLHQFKLEAITMGQKMSKEVNKVQSDKLKYERQNFATMTMLSDISGRN